MPITLDEATQYYWRVRVGFDEAATGWPTEMPDWSTSTFTTTGLALSTQDITLSEYNIYPNPSNGELNIKNPNATNFVIYNQTGSIITSEKMNNDSKTIQLNNVSSGIYLIQFFNENGLLSKDKIIIR